MAASLRRCAALLAAILTIVIVSLGLSSTAHAATLKDQGPRILAMAETRAGDPYVYGDAGPNAFDSGLVSWAAHQLGIDMPRDTEDMLSTGVAEGLLVRTSHPVPGDLAFYGTGHVELFQHGHDVTFGAQKTGTLIGNHPFNGYWKPTAYYQVR
jgi:cell wall-associated NlpC family hydrolase